MRGDDKTIRSSLAVNDVLGHIDADELSRAVQNKCGAGHLRVDASSKNGCDVLIEYESSADSAYSTAGSFAIAEEMRPRVINLDFPALPIGSGRSEKLVENGTPLPASYSKYLKTDMICLDAFLASVLDLLSSDKYTVVYTTSPSNEAQRSEPVEPESYEMDSLFQSPVHMELKRDLSHHKRATDGNVTLPDGPLFERYQFLTPGTLPATPNVPFEKIC